MLLKDRLKELRSERDLLQKDIALLLNITSSAYGYYEQGKRIPDYDTVKILADFFNVSLDYLSGSSNIKESAETLLKDRYDNLKPIDKINNLAKDNKIETLAAHFDGEDFTEDDVDDIKGFIEYVVSKRQKK